MDCAIVVDFWMVPTSVASWKSQSFSLSTDMKSVSLLYVIIFLSASSGLIRSRFRSIKCTPLNETIASFNYCFLKAYSRTYVTVNWGITRHYPFEKPQEVLKLYSHFNSLHPFIDTSGQNQDHVPIWEYLSRCSSYRV